MQESWIRRRSAKKDDYELWGIQITWWIISFTLALFLITRVVVFIVDKVI